MPGVGLIGDGDELGDGVGVAQVRNGKRGAARPLHDLGRGGRGRVRVGGVIQSEGGSGDGVVAVDLDEARRGGVVHQVSPGGGKHGRIQRQRGI